MLGAGLVTRPIVRFFLEQPDIALTVGSLFLKDAQGLVGHHPRGQAVAIDVADPAQLDRQVGAADLVVSLVPYEFHASVAVAAIRHRINMVTTSYISPEMRALDADARQAGVMVLNEIGLDPGLDHISALRLFERVRSTGGTIEGFRSCCGGLPAPESADNPWRYKFSWSPRGVFLASRNAARYLEDGRVVDIPGPELFEHVQPYDVEGLGRFEMYPNRDSLRYIEIYQLEGIKTMQRGTIRYPGWCETLQALVRLGLLDIEPKHWPPGTTHAGFMEAFVPAGPGPLARRLAASLNLAAEHPIIERLRWSGLLDDGVLPRTTMSPLDVLSTLLAQHMSYTAGQRDMVVLRHEVTARWPDRPAERLLSLLIAYGEPDGDSATSRTVSLPAALAAKLILDGDLHLPGVHLPTRPEIAESILDALATMGISFKEWSELA